MNREALEQLYDTHAEAVFRFLSALVRDEHEARDHLQNVFVKIARSPNCLHGIDAPRSYMLRIARNLVIGSAFGLSPEPFPAKEGAPASAEKQTVFRDLHQLYPLLVHVNLFGGSYVGAVTRALEQTL